jgi:phosphoglycerate dehydrogenase-like enzyme
VVVDPADAEALVWMAGGLDPETTAAALTDVLERYPHLRWVQLPWAGVEQYAQHGLIDHQHLWTCAKGVYAEPVAEHALTLTMACFRHLKEYARAQQWTAQAGRSLFECPVTIFGGGGITQALINLLQPFRGPVTVVRKRPAPVDGAVRVLGWDQREEALAGAGAVVLALALTPETTHFMGRSQFEAMDADACLINVARGAHVVTDDLTAALAEGQISAAGLDVTDPEPLPPGHRLWSLDNCIITPHTANTEAMAAPLLSRRITENVRRLAAGEPLEGVVDPDLGY